MQSLVHLELEAGCRAGLLCPGLHALGNLTRLQSLDIHVHLGGCAGAREFPRQVLALTQLRRLRLCIPNIDFLALPPEVRSSDMKAPYHVHLIIWSSD